MLLYALRTCRLILVSSNTPQGSDSAYFGCSSLFVIPGSSLSTPGVLRYPQIFSFIACRSVYSENTWAERGPRNIICFARFCNYKMHPMNGRFRGYHGTLGVERLDSSGVICFNELIILIVPRIFNLWRLAITLYSY